MLIWKDNNSDRTVRRVLQWIRVAGRVRFQWVANGEYRVTSEYHRQAVTLTLDELNKVKAASGAIALETMPC